MFLVVTFHTRLTYSSQSGIGVKFDEKPIPVFAICFEDSYVGYFQVVSPLQEGMDLSR
jgi:hypothetical protein